MVYLIFSSSGASSLGASPLALGAVIVSFLLEPSSDVTDHSQKENAYM
jgi:hypothetical protein